LGCERGEWVALAGNKGRFAQPTIRFPIFGINDNMLVVVWGLGLRRDSRETKEGLPPYPRRWSGQETSGKRRQGLREIATRCPARLSAVTIPESKAGQAR
jgi:hypothetical protein